MQASQNIEMQEEPLLGGSKKRSLAEYMKPQQLMASFKSKSDFITYFSESRKKRS